MSKDYANLLTGVPQQQHGGMGNAAWRDREYSMEGNARHLGECCAQGWRFAATLQPNPQRCELLAAACWQEGLDDVYTTIGRQQKVNQRQSCCLVSVATLE